MSLRIAQSLNRTFMELKLRCKQFFGVRQRVLIVPLWN